MKKLPVSIFAASASFSIFVQTAFAATTLDSAEASILSVLKSIAPILVGFAVIFFLWSALKFSRFSQSDEERTQAKAMMDYGVVAIFVIISLWGIIAVLGNMLGLDNTNNVSDFQDLVPTY